MSVHESARRGFQREADAYERGRPTYPDEAVAWLVDQLVLGPGRIVVDVGAGTGKLTRALLPSGAEVIAAEPVAAMREVLEREVPRARSLDATAEALPLGEGTADAVVAAQAFHWFATPAALAEFHRVLRPGGRLGLIWNARDREQQLHRDVEAIIAPYRRGTPAHQAGDWRQAMERTDLFAFADGLTVSFEHPLGIEAFVDRVASTSFVAALDDSLRSGVLRRVRDLAVSKLEPLRYVTEVFIYDRLPASGGAGGGPGVRSAG